MIRVRNLHKVYKTSFGTNHVLDDVNFDLAKGEKLGILGRNGAGKSTLVRLVSGAEQPSAGTIERTMSVSWPLAFGGAFQTELTGRDNVRFISRLHGQDFERNLAFVTEFAELGPYLREPVRTYSSGMRARLAFAISMIIEFDCFLIDEVGAVGDARFHERCNFELFTKRADRAMIIISHDAAYVRDHCNRFGVLHDSRLTFYDDFELAYGVYAKLVSLSHASALFDIAIADRASPRDVILRTAMADERFRIHAQRGDWARDKHEWANAATEYAAALALHPFASTYWSQLGHTARAQSKFVSAEIAYRNACALGQPVRDVRPFLVDVMAHQSVNEQEFPIHCFLKGPLSFQSPASPDVLVFSWAFWGMDTVDENTLLQLMRTNPTLDDLASAMIADTNRRYAGSGADATETRGATPCDLPGDMKRAQSLCQLARPDFNFDDPEAIRARFDRCQDVVSEILHASGFSEWPKTLAAFAEIQPAHNLPENNG
jgi:ABC-type polysaccharide/polyol phosphate transport system ATPase subunit